VAKIVSKSHVVIASLLKAKKDLESLLVTVSTWKKNGVDGRGVIPFAILPIEEKLKKSINDIEEMIKVASML